MCVVNNLDTWAEPLCSTIKDAAISKVTSPMFLANPKTGCVIMLPMKPHQIHLHPG